jgi:hypothetical protein
MAENSKDQQPSADMVPIDQIARLFEMTPERVRQLSKLGYISIPKRGYTTLVSAVRGYVRFLKEDARKETKTAAVSRVTDARAREVELRIAEKERELIPRDDANLALDLVVGEVNKQLTGLSARITRDVSLRRKIEAEVYETKRKIAEALASGKDLNRTGRDPTDADAAEPS